MISCLIDIEGRPYKPHRPYQFASLPRVGETVSLEWDGERYPVYRVYNILHVPEGAQTGGTSILLYVRPATRS